MKRLHLIIILCLLAVALSVSAQVDDYDRMAQRAARYFEHQEWPNASALYTVMIGERPTEVENYGRALVASGMMADTVAQIDLTQRALRAHVPVDSLLASVERTSFSVGQTSMYEQYLLRLKAHQPWLARIIDGYLLRYYAYRRYAPGMIQYSTVMLDGNPDNVDYLYLLAQGYLISNQIDRAVDTYKRILFVDPQELDALLYLGCYYATVKPMPDDARAYLTRAYSINPTPYVDSLIKNLSTSK